MKYVKFHHKFFGAIGGGLVKAYQLAYLARRRFGNVIIPVQSAGRKEGYPTTRGCGRRESRKREKQSLEDSGEVVGHMSHLCDNLSEQPKDTWVV